jgi:hypothetical protein
MTRATVVALAAGLAVCAGPACGDPSFEVPRAQAQNTPQQPAPAAPAQGAPPPAAEDGARYSFHRVGEGFVRLDLRTGELSQCGWGATGWSCKLVPDERAALDGEIARLQRENAALKKTLLSKDIELPPGAIAEAPAPRADAPVPPEKVPDASPQPPKSPADADLDRAIDYVKKVWRKLVDMMIDLQRDMQRKS